MDSTTDFTVTISNGPALARAYIRHVYRVACRRPTLPLDHSTPPRGMCCVPPPAMVAT